jgi:ParB-like nuclease domain
MIIVPVLLALDRLTDLVIDKFERAGTENVLLVPARGKSANTSPLSRRARARARVEPGNLRPWPADKVERWAIERLIPYAKNARTHTDAQVAAIAASIKEWGWTSPALVGEDGGLIAGHARVLAARQLGIEEKKAARQPDSGAHAGLVAFPCDRSGGTGPPVDDHG